MTNQELLEQAYEATAEDFLYAVGLFAVPDQPPAPLIQLHHRDWSREQLEVIRATFGAGITLIHDHRPDQGHDFHLATRETFAVQVTQAGHTSVLQARPGMHIWPALIPVSLRSLLPSASAWAGSCC